MGTFIDIHAIQTLPPSNPNRDGEGRPKTCTYGNTTRMRVSSQAWKKTIRDYFHQHADTSKLGSRSREFTGMVNQRLDNHVDTATLLPITKLLMKELGLPADKQREGSTSALQFFGERQWQAIAETAQRALDSDDPEQVVKDARKPLKQLLDSDTSLDVALFGRMSASDEKGSATQYSTDAASQFAHAISVNTIKLDSDFFTTVDDMAGTSGAGMVGETGFTSATLYRYACVDVNLLYRNVGQDRQAVTEALTHLLNGFATTLPSGKVNAFAHGTLPSFVMVEIRHDRPMNLVEAFERPVDADTIPTAVQRLLDQRESYETIFGMEDAPTFITADLNAQPSVPDHLSDAVMPLPRLVESVTALVDGELR